MTISKKKLSKKSIGSPPIVEKPKPKNEPKSKPSKKVRKKVKKTKK